MLLRLFTVVSVTLLPFASCYDNAELIVERAVAAVTSGLSSSCCIALSLALGTKVSLPVTPAYDLSLATYWSVQESSTLPGCIVLPTTTSDVAISVGILSRLGAHNQTNPACQFAVRSGGHAPTAGAANINAGVTIDLSAMKQVTPSADQTMTRIGPGAIWADVYLKLDALGLAVPGGRVAQVGVGGLTTGGGISFYSPRVGFVCDNVVNYEVVIANGSVLNVNSKQYADLQIALRGGSNNFGIVTAFDMRTFKQGKLWGGGVFYDISTAPQQLQALADFTAAEPYDEYASVIVSFAYAGPTVLVAANSLVYTKPIVNPPSLQPFTAIPDTSSTMRITNLTDLTLELGIENPTGRRDLFITTTYNSNLAILNKTVELWQASVASIELVTGIGWALSLEPIPPAIFDKTAALGGNSLGINPKDKPLMVALVSASWTLSTDDAIVTTTAKKLFAAIDAAAAKLGDANSFRYLNYAATGQDPIGGYGAASKANLQKVGKKYDSKGVFQKQVPGGFKLFT
ncbi:hypothetical protein MMC25_007020 [Agyrium rufum]|nr:hypothetical protein [Agyrium rufum]